jgi:epoxyqueuosine reductase
VLAPLKVLLPVASGIAKWLYRHSSHSVRPFNVKFARALADDSPFPPRAALGDKDARTLAHELLGMTQEEFSAAFEGSPMQRAMLPGLKRNAAVVLGNTGTMEDVPALEHALADPEARGAGPSTVVGRMPARASGCAFGSLAVVLSRGRGLRHPCGTVLPPRGLLVCRYRRRPPHSGLPMRLPSFHDRSPQGGAPVTARAAAP